MFAVLLFTGMISANAAVNSVTPSTNDENRDKGWVHFNVTETRPGEVDVDFVNPRSCQSRFEYRIDGAGPVSPLNRNPLVTDGEWPYFFVNNRTSPRTFIVISSLEIRVVFGSCDPDERFDWTPVTLWSPPSYTAIGFMPPLDKNVAVKKANRVLPLRFYLTDSDGASIAQIAPPVLSLNYVGGYIYPSGFLEELNFSGKGDVGNQFVFDGTYWCFNLSTKGLASGTYTIGVVSGDLFEYTVDTCNVNVEIE